jgi:hypothetical protein
VFIIVLTFWCEMLNAMGKQAARKAVEVGAAGVIVSNHGARQLDYAPATISALEEVTLNRTVLVVILFAQHRLMRSKTLSLSKSTFSRWCLM